MKLAIHSTRLFPKSLGADRYTLSGIAARCDWVLLSDTKPPHVFLRKTVETDAPRHIFISMRDPFRALKYFAEELLPGLSRPFRLLTGSEDVTLPNQTDGRWRAFNEDERRLMQNILDHPALLVWAVENLDERTHPKLKPMPAGLVYSDAPQIRAEIDAPDITPLGERETRVLCAHRLREGDQWAPRRKVSTFAASVWSSWCTVPGAEISEKSFLEELGRHAFVLCVEGGGIDPAPKAWQAILRGAIPIVRKSPLFEAYERFPIFWVDDWSADALSREALEEFQRAHAMCHDDPQKRAKLLRMLSADYWWHYFTGSGSLGI